jgi:hypothetical protein
MNSSFSKNTSKISKKSGAILPAVLLAASLIGLVAGILVSRKKVFFKQRATNPCEGK